jgi:uncharacterized protein YggU (UPF0235/DUF167 family)
MTERTSLLVRAHPRAATTSVGPWAEGVLHVRVTRPPADGQANDAVRRLVAGALGLPPTRVRIVAGERARTKRLEVDGLAAGELAARLAAIGSAD